MKRSDVLLMINLIDMERRIDEIKQISGQPISFQKLNERVECFKSKIQINQKTGCWEWLGSTYNTGYGAFPFNKRMLLAHRFSYEIFVGPIPDSLVLCHKCDNRICVNPNHLFPGTHGDNAQDAVKKKRNVIPKGTKVQKGQAPLKPNTEVLTKVREYFKQNPSTTNHQASIDLGVDPMTIRNIRSRRPATEIRLSEDEVLEIKKLLDNKTRVVDIAKMFDVSVGPIYNIKNGKTFKNVV